MLNNNERAEFELFSLLTDVQNPMGSVTLSLLLKEKNLNISSATVGRMLVRFDHEGLTVRHGFRGRVLTDAGLKRFKELKNKQHFEELTSKFYESIDAESKDNLIEVLVARRGIEQESVRLAAARATKEDLQNLKKLYSHQNKDASKGIVSPEFDVLFHQAIARASKNKVLLAAYDFIWQNGRFSPVMEYIRISVGGTIATDHGKILNALLERDADKAVKCMAGHIDSLISDVQKYWNLSHKNASDKEKGGGYEKRRI